MDACGEFEHNDAAGKRCEKAERAMAETLDTPPNWGRYAPNHERTAAISEYWNDKTRAGGPLTEDLATPAAGKIVTPLAELLATTTTYGLYNIDKVIVTSGRPYYRDITILSTKKADTPKLKEFAADTRAKCCYTHEGAKGMEQHMTGFARLEMYMDTELNGAKPQFLEIVYEGQMLEGAPHGFGRKIDGRASQSFTGYFKDWYTTMDGASLGVYFEYHKLIYAGLYHGGTFYRSQDAEANQFADFNDFDIKVLKATRWTYEIGYCAKGAANNLETWGRLIPDKRTERVCKDFCALDTTCTAYEWHNAEKECRNFYGEIQGDGLADLEHACQIKPTSD